MYSLQVLQLFLLPIFVINEYPFEFQEPTKMVSDPFLDEWGQTLCKLIQEELIPMRGDSLHHSSESVGQWGIFIVVLLHKKSPERSAYYNLMALSP